MTVRASNRAQRRRAAKARVSVHLIGLFDDGADTGPKWVQVTREGDFPGYMGGLQPFAFTRKDLDDMVANIKSHPAYQVDASGVATGRVIPWDFNHASEANPTSGDLPAAGAPSQGWTLDMQVRNGADGKAELWALTEFLEPARTYVKSKQYLWASVAVSFNAVHAETGQNVGALVTSIALTNTPFVEGMAELVASRQPAGDQQVSARRTWFEAARDPGEAITFMRELFALPETSGAAEVMQQVGIIKQWLESGTAPLGTNPEELVGSMRLILNLPALTSQMDVIAEASRSIQALLEEEATAAGIPAAPTATGEGNVPEPPDIAARRQQEEANMDLLKALATALGVRESDESVKAAVTELAELRTALCSALGLSQHGGARVILEAAKDGVDAKTKLLGLFEALGVADPDAALQKVASTLEAAAKLREVMPELEGLKADKAAAEETAAEADVDQAIAARKLDPSLKGALLLQRKNDPEGFAKSFPKTAPAAPAATGGKPVPAHLLSSVASKGGAPLNGGQPATTGGPEQVNLAMYPGANSTARAKAYLAGTVPNWDKLSNDDKFLRAVELKKQPHVVDEQPAA